MIISIFHHSSFVIMCYTVSVFGSKGNIIMTNVTLFCITIVIEVEVSVHGLHSYWWLSTAVAMGRHNIIVLYTLYNVIPCQYIMHANSYSGCQQLLK